MPTGYYPRRNTRYQWLRAAISNHDSNDCLLWPFSKSHNGYGTIWMPDGTMARVHRVAFKLTYGHWPVPQGLHSCDTPACFNPRHIFEGTPSCNTFDMVIKGRCHKGEECPRARLTDDIVRKIRAEYIPSVVSYRMLAEQYGVGTTAIQFVIQRKTWKHVTA